MSRYFRIHVVANSNSIKDQVLKYKVANKVNNYLNELYKNKTSISKDDSKDILTDHISELLDLVENTIEENGYDYSSNIEVGKIHYGKKSNNDIEMAAGVYDSVRIGLGKGKGKNWWSLIYPYSYSEVSVPNSIYYEQDTLKSDNIVYSSIILELLKKIF